MIQHKTVTENLVRKEKGTTGVGVFCIKRGDLDKYTTVHVDDFVKRVYPMELNLKVTGDIDAYATALDLSEGIDEFVLLALNCKKAGLLKGEDSKLYDVGFKIALSGNQENIGKIIFCSLSHGDGTTTIPIDLPLDKFFELKIHQEGRLLLKITEDKLIFYYNTKPYFTRSAKITFEKGASKYIKQQIVRNIYGETERIAHQIEPSYMGSLTQPHVVLWGGSLQVSTNNTYLFYIVDKRLRAEAKEGREDLYRIADDNPLILLVLDEEERAAIYY